MEENDNSDSEGVHEIAHTCCVKYQTQDGRTVKAMLGNAPRNRYKGVRTRIKYLPEKPRCVIPVK